MSGKITREYSKRLGVLSYDQFQAALDYFALGTVVAEIISQHFPEFVLGEPATVTSSGKPITVQSNFLNDCKKAKSVLGATIRPVEDTIRDVVESSIELGIITPQLK